jgi:hypothetical protein
MIAQAGGFDLNALVQRLRRLATFDTSVFDEIKDDANSTLPAAAVVVVSMFLTGIGGWLWYEMQDNSYKAGTFLMKSAIFGSVLSIILWGVWVGVTYVMLSQVFRARADINHLIRVMGFAAAPLALGVLLFIPKLSYGIGLTSFALLFGLTTIAVQSATDASGGRALAANAAGFAVWAIVLVLFVSGSAPWDSYAPGIFIFAAPTV